MHVIVWRFRAQEEERSAFEAAYSGSGAWAKLFAEAPGFISTELLRSAEGSYLVIDRWESEGSYEAFRKIFTERYDDLDRACAALTREEIPVGSFVSLG